MSSDDESPILHVDDDWKAQAQAEKAKLAEKEKAAKEQAQTTGGEAEEAFDPYSKMPEANFQTLVQSIASQAILALGMPHPQTGQRFLDLDFARHQIDSLSVLEEKTQGNLSEEEQTLLSSTLYELRSTYVQVSNASRSPATGGPAE